MSALKNWNHKLIEKSRTAFARFCDDVRGATMVEYSVLIGLITAAIIAIIAAVGTWITTQWQTLCTALTGAAC
jgi:pilus assembly protein Flp/PilA